MTRKASLERQMRWRQRLGRFSRSTLSVAEFCRRVQVSVPSFYQWRKKLAVTADDGQDTTPPAKTGDRRVKRTHFGAEMGPTWGWFGHVG